MAVAEVVLDSSAVLALLRAEPGAAQVEAVIARALISVVNEAEVVSKLIWRGDSSAHALEIVAQLPYEAAPLDQGLAYRAGSLWELTKRYGLSLADRCCLALAEREHLPVLTADAIWRSVEVGVEIRLLAGRRGA
jgi:PIN domain nuclease of toxin-antitoxin system